MEENETSHKSDVDCLQLQVTQTKTQATNLAESVSSQTEAATQPDSHCIRYTSASALQSTTP